MHTDTAVGAWSILHPASVESVVSLEFTPVGHWCALEAPAGWLLVNVSLFALAAIVGIAVAVGAVIVLLFENAEVAFRGRCGSGSYGYRHDQQRRLAFHYIDHLVAGRDLYPDIGRVSRFLGWQVIIVIGPGG